MNLKGRIISQIFSRIKAIRPRPLLKRKKLHEVFFEKPSLKKVITALAHSQERRRYVLDNFFISTYFAFGGLVFDLLNPEVGAIYYAIHFINPQSVPSSGNPSQMVGQVLLINSIAGLFVYLVFIFTKRSQLQAFLIGISFALVGYIHLFSGFIGIITIVWHAGLGAMIFGILILQSIVKDSSSLLYPIAIGMDNPPSNDDFFINILDQLRHIRDTLWDLVKVIVQVVLSFIAITGVTMTILFQKGYQAIQTQLMGIQMVTAFFVSVLALYLWVVSPALNSLSRIRTLEEYCVLNNLNLGNIIVSNPISD